MFVSHRVLFNCLFVTGGASAVREEQHCFSVGNAQCSKDNAEIVKGTFGTALNNEMKAIREAKQVKVWLQRSDDEEGAGDDEGGRSWDEAKVTIGEQEEDGELINDYFVYRELPIDLWVAGDLKWLAAAYGKENSSGHWCPWCLKSAREWSGANQENNGPFWTLELLCDFADGVRSGRLKSSSERRGVVSEAAIDYVGPEKIAFPILHATLGFGNDWLKSFTKEMQAASEAYTAEYLLAEEELGKAVDELDASVQRLREYRSQVRDFVRDSKRALRRRGANALGQVQKDLLTTDLQKIDLEVVRLQEIVNSCKVAREGAKEAFDLEAGRDANSKAYGQPIRKGIEEILKKHGIDKGAAFGGDLQGNACRRLMQNANVIVEEVKAFMTMPETAATRVVGSDDDIRERCDLYAKLLTAFDGCISGLRTKRFHVTEDIVQQTDGYVKKVMELSRYLGFSITPKLHCLESHAVHFLRKHHGFADLAEDAGERAHQLESKKDLRWAAQRSHDRREIAKAASEAKESDPRVRKKLRQMQEKTRAQGSEKRKLAVDENREERKKLKVARREEILDYQVLEGRASKFSDQRVARFSRGHDDEV